MGSSLFVLFVMNHKMDQHESSRPLDPVIRKCLARRAVPVTAPTAVPITFTVTLTFTYTHIHNHIDIRLAPFIRKLLGLKHQGSSPYFYQLVGWK